MHDTFIMMSPGVCLPVAPPSFDLAWCPLADKCLWGDFRVVFVSVPTPAPVCVGFLCFLQSTCTEEDPTEFLSAINEVWSDHISQLVCIACSILPLSVFVFCVDIVTCSVLVALYTCCLVQFLAGTNTLHVFCALYRYLKALLPLCDGRRSTLSESNTVWMNANRISAFAEYHVQVHGRFGHQVRKASIWCSKYPVRSSADRFP